MSRSKPGKMPSQRQLRVGELIRHALAEVLARGDVRDPDLEGRIVTVSEVRASNDLRHAVCYVSHLGGTHTADVVKGLNRCRKFLRGEVGHRMTTKFTPDLKFEADTSFDEGSKIDALLRSTRVAQDVAQARDDSEEFGEEE